MRDLAFDGEGRLHCPVCNETMGTHLDEVTMMARPDGEDGPLVARHLDDRGQLATTRPPRWTLNSARAAAIASSSKGGARTVGIASLSSSRSTRARPTSKPRCSDRG